MNTFYGNATSCQSRPKRACRSVSEPKHGCFAGRTHNGFFYVQLYFDSTRGVGLLERMNREGDAPIGM